MSEPEVARLIPVSGISGQREAEQRAVSALLAVLSIVRPFSVALLGPLGSTRARTACVETFVEPFYEIEDKSTAFSAPDDRTARARLVWLVRQLKHAHGSLLVDAYPKSSRIPTTASLEQLRQDPREGIPVGGQAAVRFELRQQTHMGSGRRSTRKKGFIDSVIDAVMDFYASALQDLKPFVPRAPAIDRTEAEPVETE